MFCPGCGLKEKNANQFCRACGTDLRRLRLAVERTDNITESAATARDEIGRAVAARIREFSTAKELKQVAEDVLPEIEKFLESPEEKRLRRVRTGTLIASIGLGAAIGFAIASKIMADEGVFVIAAMGLITFFIGLSFVINGLLFTVPKKSLSDKSGEARTQRELDTDASTAELALPEPSNDIYTSVTEHTTHRLKEKQTIPRG